MQKITRSSMKSKQQLYRAVGMQVYAYTGADPRSH
jgi:hypothetical protein